MNRRVTAALSSRLTNSLVFFGGRDQSDTFSHVVADWFLNIDVLTGLHCPNPTQCMPMVGSRSTDRLNRIIVKRSSHVSHKHWPLALLFGNLVTFLVSSCLVDINDVQNFSSRVFKPSSNVTLTPPARTDNRNSNFVVR